MTIATYVLAHAVSHSLAYEPIFIPGEKGAGRRSYRGTRAVADQREKHPATQSRRASPALERILRRAKRRG